MRFHTFLLKYGEIGIKGKNRYLFEDALVRQVRYALKDVEGTFTVYKSQARIYVDCEGEYDYDDTVEHLKRVFGLVGICPVVRMEDQGFDQLKKDVVAYMDEVYPDKKLSFKVEARRARKGAEESCRCLCVNLTRSITIFKRSLGLFLDTSNTSKMH